MLILSNRFRNNKPTKIGFKTLKDGKKVRYSKETGEVIDAN